MHAANDGATLPLRPAVPTLPIALDRRIDALQRTAAADRRVICLGGGLPSDGQFPRGALAAAFVRVLAPGSTALQYGWPEGSPKLRELIAARLRSRGAKVTAQDVLITNGGQQAIDLALQLATRRNEPIGVDTESYPAALELFRLRRRRPTTSLRAATRYVMPAVDNPRGVGLTPAQRRELLRSGATLLEDDAYADLRFDGPAGRPLLADAPDRVWHIGTFSKTLCPGLRLGWLVPPRKVRARALRLKQDSDLQSSGLAQAIIEGYLQSADFDARLKRLRKGYQARAARLLAAVRRHVPELRCTPPEGGFALWLTLDDALNEVKLLRAAVRHGVSFDPGSLFRPDRSPRPTGLRLCFSYAPPDAFDEGARRLRRALRDVRRG